MRRAVFCAAMVLLCLHACTSIDVKTDFDPGTDFNGLRTFAFTESTGPDYSPDDSPARKQIQSIIAGELTNKGLRQVGPEDNPDVHVHYLLNVKEKEIIQRSNPTGASYERRGGYAAGGGYGFGGHGTGGGYGLDTKYQYKEGTLIIDLVEPGKNELVWRATIVADLQNTTEGNSELARQAIAKAFRNYPPK